MLDEDLNEIPDEDVILRKVYFSCFCSIFKEIYSKPLVIYHFSSQNYNLRKEKRAYFPKSTYLCYKVRSTKHGRITQNRLT
jgi:hypothetical protein